MSFDHEARDEALKAYRERHRGYQNVIQTELAERRCLDPEGAQTLIAGFEPDDPDVVGQGVGNVRELVRAYPALFPSRIAPVAGAPTRKRDVASPEALENAYLSTDADGRRAMREAGYDPYSHG